MRPARPNAPAFVSGTTGLHHLCFYVDSDAEVDALYEMLRTTGVRCDAPDAYPQYEDGYYAIFFEDPDGIRLEVRSMNTFRRETAEYWREIPDGFA